MRISIATWNILDWQGPSSNVRFRVTADDTFVAREDDNTGVQIESSPKVFREVDCTVDTVVIEGLTVKRITVPAMWLYSTNDAIVNKQQARYSTAFVTTSGQVILRPSSLQSIQLIKELEDVFNPVPLFEVIRANNPAAPFPMDKDTFSKEQILELIGDGSILKGANATSPRVAFWSGPITVDGATGFEYQNADQMLRLVQQNALWNVFRIVEDAGAANLKVGGNPALFSSHVLNEAGLSHRAIINDGATRRWTEVVKDGAFGLQYSAYDSGNALQSNTIFDPAGGIGFSDSSAEFGYFYKASSAYHFGIAASVGASGASKEITFTATGVGINKSTSIGSQLHVVSGNAARIGLLVDTAGSPSQPIMELRNGVNVRFSFNHDGVATFGLVSAVKGRLNFAAATNGNIHSLEAPDTPAANVQYKLPAASPANGQLLRTLTFSGGIATLEWVNPTAGGDVSSDIGVVVDNTLTRFNGTTGKIITDSAIIVADTTGSFTVPNGWTITSAGATVLTVNGNNFSFSVPTGAVATRFTFLSASQTQSSGVAVTSLFQSTYNQTSTAGSRELSLIRVETALGSGEHNFIRGEGGAAGTTYRFRINNLGNYFFGATGGFIGDENGNEYLRFVTTASAVNELTVTNAATGNGPSLAPTGGDTNIPLNFAAKGNSAVNFSSNIDVVKDSPSFTMADNVGGVGSNFTINLNAGFTNIGRLGNTDLQLDNSTGVYTFTAIPVGPNSTPTTDNQLARKKYVDDRIVTFVIPFRVDDPSTFATSDDGAAILVQVPSIVGAFLSKITIIRPSSGGGSHTSGGTATFIARIFNSSNVGSGVAFSDSNNLANTIYTEDFSDTSIVENNYITFNLTRSGTISERNVSINIHGYRKHQN